MSTKPEAEMRHNEQPESPRHGIGDSIAHGIESTIVGFLTSLCRGFLVTPESIERQKPGVRGNAPPPTGGISSLG